MNVPALCLSILGIDFRVEGAAGHLRALLIQNFAVFQAAEAAVPAFCTIHSLPGNRLILESTRSGILWESSPTKAADADDYFFLYALEKELTLELQRSRRDLYFVHAAVLERDDHCILIAAESGTGKSTLAYALQQRGFRYMSDELAPVDVGTLSVFAYKHALCLKSTPPSPFADLPEHFTTERTLHIPVSQLNAVNGNDAVSLQAMIFLHRSGQNGTPSIREISPAEAAARLYGNTLNALAHTNSGLDAAAAIAERIPAYQLEAGELDATCKLLDAFKR